MNDGEFSDIEIFQHSGKGIPLFMTGHKIACKPITTMGGVSSFLKTERNNICDANVIDYSARKYKGKFSTETENQGSLYPVLKSSNTEYCFFASSHCSSACFETRVAGFFKFNRPTDLNFNMNKRQGTLFNFGVKKSRIEGVCDATNKDSSTSSLQSDLQDVQKEGKTNRKSLHSLVSTWTAI